MNEKKKELDADTSERHFLDGPKYTAREIKKIENQPGAWNSLEVGVFEGEKQIGTYVRNYHVLYKTFFPFEQKGKWYALVSRDYTATEVMSLPSCEFIGGEKRNKGGFCPVEFYVPNYIKLTFPDINKKYHGGDKKWNYEPQIDLEDFGVKDEHDASFHHFDFGFVAGCYWGDDWSWKVQHLDLSRAAEGIVARSEKFGYVWLGANCTLADSVNIILFDDPQIYKVGLSVEKIYDICPDDDNDYSNFDTGHRYFTTIFYGIILTEEETRDIDKKEGTRSGVYNFERDINEIDDRIKVFTVYHGNWKHSRIAITVKSSVHETRLDKKNELHALDDIAGNIDDDWNEILKECCTKSEITYRDPKWWIRSVAKS
jgi:hypothetical protein